MKTLHAIVTLAAVSCAAVAGAQMMAHPPGPGGSWMQPVVAPDGTAVLVRPLEMDENGQPQGMEVVAYGVNGAQLWSHRLDGGVLGLVLFADLVVTVAPPGDHEPGSGPMPGDGEHAARLVGLELDSGVAAWELELDTRPMGFATGGGLLYVTAVDADDASMSGENGGHGDGSMRGRHGGGGSMSGPRHGTTLIAIAADGQVLWTVAVTER